MRTWKRMAALALAGLLAVPSLGITAGGFKAEASESENVSGRDNLEDNQTTPPEAWGALPDANQYQYQKEELAAFCHFGMNTFTGSEWGNGKESPGQFNPTKKFDADTYVQTLQEAGFKKVIVTAKHHDGFCIWKSAYTEHDVESSPYDGDILEELSAACTKYNMNMGLYLSPWDVNNASYGYYDENGNALVDGSGNPKDGMTWEEVYAKDVLDYNEYYNNQLIEILGNKKYGNNGKFNEVWMDGAKGSGSAVQNYDFVKWFDTIQKYEGKAAGREADCMLFGAQAYTTVRWIGNELGFANEETWSKSNVDKEKNTINSNNIGSYTKGFPEGNQWTVPESDARITSGWFWGPNKATPKTMQQLSEMYFRSVGHNSTFLLNVPPNRDGTVDEAILNRITEFGQEVKKTFGNNLAGNAAVTASSVRGSDVKFSPENVLDEDDDTYWTMDDESKSGSLTLDLGSTKTFDVVSIEEAIQLGQRITSYKVEYKNGSGSWQVFEEGTTVGARRLCRQTPVKADKVRITVSSQYAVPLVSEVGVYKASKEFAIGNAVPEAVTVIDNLDKDVSDGSGFTYNASAWTQETNASFINGTGMWANAPAECTLTFTGTKAWVVGTVDPNHGRAEVYLDGSETPTDTFDTYRQGREVNVRIYETPTLEPGVHTVRIKGVTTNKAIGIQGAYALNNEGRGMVELEQEEYVVNEGDSLTVKVRRVGGSSSSMTVLLQDNPGSAVQSEYVPTDGLRLEFAEGETEKEATIQTKINDEKTADCEFYLEVVPAADDENAAIGFNSTATVTIIDQTSVTKEKLDELVTTAQTKNSNHFLAESYQAFQTALEAAQEVASRENPTSAQVREAYGELKSKMDALVARITYSKEDPFVFPIKDGENGLLEAEFFELDPVSGNKYVRITENGNASNGKEINWFESGNKIKLPFTARRAGTYHVVATYRSGRAQASPNAFEWSGTNVSSGSLDVYGPESNVYKTAEFDLEVAEEGEGELIFTAGVKAGPVIDKFVISPKDLNLHDYTITASASEGGSISDPGETKVNELESKTYTITPDEGYEISDVLVNGESVGAVSTYTFTDLKEDAVIEAQFAFSHYTEDHPYVLPMQKEILEAEHFKLDPIEGSKYVRITTRTDASNGKEVNWFEDGNKIRLPFQAEKAGTYHVVATYRSGRAQASPNAFEWDGTNISSGNLDVYGPEPNVYKTAEFDITVPEVGAGEWVFTASAKAGPVIDKFEIEYKQPAEGVSLDRENAVLSQAGETLQLTATVQPENAFNKGVTWTSTVPEVATVDENGLVTAAAAGTTTIIAATEDGSFTATCEITVKISQTVAVNGVTISQDTARLTAEGAVIQLSASVSPENATNKEVTWSTSNPEAATVDENGLVTAVADGDAVITVTTVEGGFTDECTVNVEIAEEPVSVSGITVNQSSVTLTEVGKSTQLVAFVLPENASNKKVTWTSSDDKIAVVDETGLVTAAGEGNATVTAVTEDGGFTAQCEVKVGKEKEVISVTGVTLDREEAKLTAIGETLQLQAHVLPENAENRKVTWYSTDERAVKVSQDGKATAVAEGSASILAISSDGGFVGICRVTVTAKTEQAPGKVSSVKAGSETTKSIKVTWNAAAGADSYKVHIYDYRTKKWTTAGTTASNSLIIQKLNSGTKYKVRVTAANKVGEGTASQEVLTATKPNKTKITKIKKSNGKVKLTYKKAGDVGYQIYMKSGTGKFKKVATTKKTSFTKRKLKKGRKYSFKIRAYVKNGSKVVYGSFSPVKSIRMK